MRLALAEIAAGKDPTYRNLVPGVLSYREYERRLRLWDEVRKKIGLDGEFDETAVTLMFPPGWMDEAQLVGDRLGLNRRPTGRVAMGLDSAQGGDNASWCIGDGLGMLDLVSMKTPDTSVIIPKTIELMQQWGIDSEDVCLDHGGGGKEHGDRLREMGYRGVRIISFGAGPTDPNLYRRMKTSDEKRDERETKYRYKNRRAEIYGLARNMLNPVLNEQVYGMPTVLMERTRSDGHVGLRGQLAPVPLLYDGDGRMFLPPKNPPSDPARRAHVNREKSLSEIIGCSPDESDAFGLMIYAKEVKSASFVIGKSGMRK